MTEPTAKRDAPKQDWRETVFLPKTPFPMKAGLPQKEPGILAAWQEQDLYRKLRETRAGAEKFILHDGPPYANGDMHIGHALNHILKDMVCRTQSLLGKDAPYVPGWDCHGLPIEWKVEEEYRKKKLNKDEVDPVEFRAECRSYAQKWVDVQREQLKRLGINGDWDHPYLTMDAEAEGTIVAELMKFAESGQLYRGAKPVMWSPVEKTALAEAEVEYEDIVSTQIDVAFEIVESPIAELVGAYAVIWTTTPWTIPVNQAIAYGPDIHYTTIETAYGTYLVACDLVEQCFSRFPTHDNVQYKGGGRILGSSLAGTIARHPMANRFRRPVLDTGLGSPSGAALADKSQAPDQVRGDDIGGMPGDLEKADYEKMAEFFLRPRPFLPGSFVTTDSGTGLVHMSPDHGEDDFELCKANGLEPVFAVEGDGKYRADWAWLGGQGSVINPRFNAPDGPICSDLRAAGGLLAASADYKHSYPHSWRSKAKVIYRCTPQWFVPMDRPIKPSPHEGRGLGEGAGLKAGVAAAEQPLTPTLSPQGEREFTLRETALTAIAATRFVPEKGRNRIGAMVEGRPDWVLSRQRAWGVPITLFVKKGTNQYLADAQVNARIVAAIKAEGVDAWTDARAQEFLGSDYHAEDYERVTDILDVWFDSGCTHAFVLESGKWPDLLRPDGYAGPKADLYLEGSDQHRGWFQSSLLEACATRGAAPYKAVLTHGFTMDAKGMKMSKSLGNTINPLDLMRDNGADILRLWALSVDFTEDHRIGKEILAGVADQYRKLRNTFRYLLGALDGFDESERVADVAAMPELERYMLALLAKLDGTLDAAVKAFDFNTYVRALTDFCNEDLSAFFFDIRKDCLYCDAASDPKRRAYRTVLDTLFHALVRYAAPVLVFTAEEVWGTRFPDAGSVHLLVWPAVDAAPADNEGVLERWAAKKRTRIQINEVLEHARKSRVIGSSLEAIVEVERPPAEQDDFDPAEMTEIAIVGGINVQRGAKRAVFRSQSASFETHLVAASVTRTTHHKCGRCWRHLPEVTEDGDLCSRCDQVVAGMDVAA